VRLLSFVVALPGVLSLSACSPASDPTEPTHTAYQGCPLDDDEVVCADNTGCIQTDVVAVDAGFCSQTCDVANDCPADPDGRTKICEQPTGASEKLCYVTCPSASSTCPEGTVCQPMTTAAGTALQACVPRE
jgi:hypothetical protein